MWKFAYLFSVLFFAGNAVLQDWIAGKKEIKNIGACLR